MCLTKVYYNTYSDGAQDITEKHYPCRDGRGCSHPEVRKYDRKFPFTKLGDVKPESYRSLSERKPTPYFASHTPRGSKSPSASGRRDSGVYYDYSDPYDGYGYHHSSSRHDPRDRQDRGRDRELRLKRSSTNPHIVYVDRDGKSFSRSRSASRDYSRDIPLGLVPLADEYGRRRHSSRSRSREGSRDESDHYYRRRRTDDPHGYVVIDDQDERRRRRREEKHRRLSTSSYTEPSSSGAAAMTGIDAYGDPYQYIPRRASTVVHHSDGSISTSSGGAVPKQLRWEDQVRAKRERQNAEIASRAAGHGEVKGILKHAGESKGKGRELDDIAELRRAVERMEIPRGRDREPRSRDDWDRGWGGYDDYDSGRRKRSKVYADDRYRY
ncbi:hypothetical protein C8A03DRAFT_44266 [Achaetomium macrosporum]|uniref:Uncharacterized protein n=1 Tax=Achaetomium macrosporum TaxID=79813 RepID=A0AAN7CAG2_9PEZI|nr:hypothetical protein C8A03DRAFT_44266 [Achaetomium macrosporum]